MKQYWNKTKVICTIGPACRDSAVLKKMIISGMDIARFNFSHGNPTENISLIKSLKKISMPLGAHVAVLQDLPGPKIRIGALGSEFIDLKKGQRFSLTEKNVIGDVSRVSINNRIFVRQLVKKDVIFLNDGLVKLIVIGKTPDTAVCEVITGGRIYPKKGVSCPTQVLKTSAVTPYDLSCLNLGIKAGIDFVAVSFVQSASDIIKVKRFIRRQARQVFVIAKIERKAALEQIDAIINASDAVMVARGDLGIEVDLTEVPFLQKEIIRKCNNMGRPVITATHMLESMVSSPVPTRAEVTDVANAILDGSDCLMLSEETAVGKFPLEALKIMLSIAAKTEVRLGRFGVKPELISRVDDGLIESFSRSAVSAAKSAGAKVIIVPTQNANSVSWLSRLRPECSVAGITTLESVYRKLILFWGVYPILIKRFGNLPETLKNCVSLVKSRQLAKKNDSVVIMLTKDNNLFESNIMEVRKLE